MAPNNLKKYKYKTIIGTQRHFRWCESTFFGSDTLLILVRAYSVFSRSNGQKKMFQLLPKIDTIVVSYSKNVTKKEKFAQKVKKRDKNCWSKIIDQFRGNDLTFVKLAGLFSRDF